MEFFFCEKCGKRLTDQDIQAGKARHKQVKGVFCSTCAEGVMTVEFEAISPEMIEQFRKEQREKQRRATTPAAAAPPDPAPSPPPARRPAPGSRPSIPVPPERRPGSGRMRPERPRYGGDGADPVAGPSKKPLIAAALAAVAVAMALAVLFMRGGSAHPIKDRVDAPDVPLAPQETAGVAETPKESVPAKTSKKPETKASPVKTVADARPSDLGPTRTIELFPTDDVEDAKGAGEIRTDRTEIVLGAKPVSMASLRFDFGPLGEKPVSARLMLHAVREPAEGSKVLVQRHSSADWSEANYAERRASIRSRGETIRMDTTDFGTFRADLTRYLDAMEKQETVLAVHLQPASRTTDVAIGSREGPEATRPRLIVEIPDSSGTVAKAQTSPLPQAGDGAVYLADLTSYNVNRMLPAEKVMVGETAYPKSMGSSALPAGTGASIFYKLNGNFTTFKAVALRGDPAAGVPRLLVALDGKTVWQDRQPECELDVRGVKVLNLGIYNGQKNGPEVKGTWLSPRLYKAKPEAEPPKTTDPAATAEDPAKVGSAVDEPGAVHLADFKQIGINLMEPAKTVTHDGKEFPKSLPSQDIPKYRTAIVVYELNGAYERFKSDYALAGEKSGRLLFLVLCDGKQVWKGEKIPCDIDVTGVKALKLAIWKDEFDPPSLKGVWLSPRLFKPAAGPKE